MPAVNSTQQIYGGQRIITALATLDFASTLTLVRSALVSVTGITGARPGDVVIVAPVTRSANQSFGGDVTANDTVSAFFDNFTAGTVDPASQDFIIIVIRTTK
jgi:hypothetical protein